MLEKLRHAPIRADDSRSNGLWRPLFCMIIAEIIDEHGLSDRSPAAGWDIKTLLKKTLEIERHTWRGQVDSKSAENLAILATLCGGLDLKECKHHVTAPDQGSSFYNLGGTDLRPKLATLEAAHRMTGRPTRIDVTDDKQALLQPRTPDILGEYFVQSSLESDVGWLQDGTRTKTNRFLPVAASCS